MEHINNKYLEELKTKTYDICIDARESKAGVESLLRQRERLKSKLFVEYRKQCSSDKMAEHLSRADFELEKLDELIKKADEQFSRNWGIKEAHLIECEIVRSQIATRREELKNGV